MGNQKSDAACTSNVHSYVVVNDQRTQNTDVLNLLYLYIIVFAFHIFKEKNLTDKHLFQV